MLPSNQTGLCGLSLASPIQLRSNQNDRRRQGGGQPPLATADAELTGHPNSKVPGSKLQNEPTKRVGACGATKRTHHRVCRVTGAPHKSTKRSHRPFQVEHIVIVIGVATICGSVFIWVHRWFPHVSVRFLRNEANSAPKVPGYKTNPPRRPAPCSSAFIGVDRRFQHSVLMLAPRPPLEMSRFSVLQ
jgi:hypothetical protein